MAHRTIKVKCYSDNQQEFVANESLLPGMLIEFLSTGKIKKQASVNSFAQAAVVMEDYYQGKEVDEEYVAGDQTQVLFPYPGDIVLVRLQDGQSVAFGDQLVAAGNGFVKKADTDFASYESLDPGMDLSTRRVLGIARETLDLSALEGSESSLEDNSQLIEMQIV